MDLMTKKHAACDECRARKLKCSGNRPGCDRCIRDRVTCYYSAQKRMGRPRKLRSTPESNPQRDSTFIESSYNTPEPMPQPKNVQFGVSNDALLNTDWLTLDSLAGFDLREIPSSQEPHTSMYDLGWNIREHSVGSSSPGSNPASTTFKVPNVAAPIPVAPIVPHLLGSQAPELHAHHPHASRFHLSTHPTATLHIPSPEFPRPDSRLLGHSPPLPPAPPASTAGNSPQNNNQFSHGLLSPQSCECLFNLFLYITVLKTHLTKTPIPFQLAISTARSAVATARLSLSCPSCQAASDNQLSSNSNLDCISDMFLGALLPMLCTFFTKVLESIELTTGEQKVQIEGKGIADMELEEWKEMARGAMRNEATQVQVLVEEMERISGKRPGMLGGALCSAAGALWEPLRYQIIHMTSNRKEPIRPFSDSIGR